MDQGASFKGKWLIYVPVVALLVAVLGLLFGPGLLKRETPEGKAYATTGGIATPPPPSHSPTSPQPSLAPTTMSTPPPRQTARDTPSAPVVHTTPKSATYIEMNGSDFCQLVPDSSCWNLTKTVTIAGQLFMPEMYTHCSDQSWCKVVDASSLKCSSIDFEFGFVDSKYTTDEVAKLRERGIDNFREDRPTDGYRHSGAAVCDRRLDTGRGCGKSRPSNPRFCGVSRGQLIGEPLLTQFRCYKGTNSRRTWVRAIARTAPRP